MTFISLQSITVTHWVYNIWFSLNMNYSHKNLKKNPLLIFTSQVSAYIFTCHLVCPMCAHSGLTMCLYWGQPLLSGEGTNLHLVIFQIILLMHLASLMVCFDTKCKVYFTIMQMSLVQIWVMIGQISLHYKRRFLLIFNLIETV